MTNYNEIWKPVASVIRHLSMEYDEAVTLGGQFGQLMAIIEMKDREIERLNMQIKSMKKYQENMMKK